MKLMVIIPAYNEEASLPATVGELREKAPEVDYIVVNDGSGDRTAEICRENGYPFLDLPTNLGLTGAFQTGMRYAYERGYDAALQLDADGQHDPAFIRPMAGMMEKESLDLVLGSRFLTKKRPRSLRMVGNALIEGALWMTTGRRISDPTCGMRLYGRRVMKHMAYSPMARPEPDTLTFLIRCGAKTGEYPVSIRERQAGESYLSMSRSFRYMAQMGMNIFILQWVMKKERL
ncbi:MAG: glycosyltransferase family 2 protein [Clostridia bacterium]|nr:glycosyltransferase family 2 protein [Clostridia bacterium]